MRIFQKISREAHLEQSILHGCFLVRKIIFINLVTIMINQLHQNLSETCHFLRLH